MNKEEILEKLGFQKPEFDEAMNFDEYFQINPSYYLETDFDVVGDHAHDAVQILYVENEKVKGFYYDSSLIKFLTNWGYEKEIKKAYKQIKKYLKVDLLIETVKGNEWFVIECDLKDYKAAELCVIEMKRAIIVFDFLMQRLESSFYKKMNKE